MRENRLTIRWQRRCDVRCGVTIIWRFTVFLILFNTIMLGELKYTIIKVFAVSPPSADHLHNDSPFSFSWIFTNFYSKKETQIIKIGIHVTQHTNRPANNVPMWGIQESSPNYSNLLFAFRESAARSREMWKQSSAGILIEMEIEKLKSSETQRL